MSIVSIADSDVVLPKEAEFFRIVENIDESRVEARVVNSYALMRRIIIRYTRSEIAKRLLLMEDAEAEGYNADDAFVDGDIHYQKLASMWGGDRRVALFSPMDALYCQSTIKRKFFDSAIAYIIAWLPSTGVNWDNALLYAMRAHRSNDIIKELCCQGAFFKDDECDSALREIACKLPVDVMDSVLRCLIDYSHRDFLSKTVVLNDATNDRGTMIHLCCCAPGSDIVERIRTLDHYGVDPALLSSVTRLRAADMLALQCSDELRGAMRLLTYLDAGPIRHHAREVSKLLSNRMSSDVKDLIMDAAYDGAGQE
jgi:hypothetical protein